MEGGGRGRGKGDNLHFSTLPLSFFSGGGGGLSPNLLFFPLRPDTNATNPKRICKTIDK